MIPKKKHNQFRPKLKEMCHFRVAGPDKIVQSYTCSKLYVF